jgi:hypothetical protein
MIFESQVTRAPAAQTRFQPENRPRLQRKRARGKKSGASGECENCKQKRADRSLKDPFVAQTQLSINQPGDAFEQQADRTANAVASNQAASVNSSLDAFHLCPDGLRSANSAETSAMGAVLDSPGQALDPPARAYMERRFRHDFSQVRVHADTRAADSAHTLNASAYTVGRDLVFGAGRYAPHTPQGRKLLAHELAHVVQQRQLGTRSLVQRAVEYVEQVADTDPTAAQMLSKFDQSVAAIEQNVKTQTGPQMADLTSAAARLKSLRASGKVAVWKMITTPPAYAGFDNGSGQLRLNYSYPDLSVSENTLVHEAIHAVHAAANPEIAAAYAKGLRSGVPETDTAVVAVVHKWKAWTEYWAYRRAAEYSAGAKLAADPDMGHRVAMATRDVQMPVRDAKVDDPSFDPKTWQPTTADKATALRFTGKSGATAKP